jgi:hypothetical protein
MALGKRVKTVKHQGRELKSKDKLKLRKNKGGKATPETRKINLLTANN